MVEGERDNSLSASGAVAERFIAPTSYLGERVQARPWVQIPPAPPVSYHAREMKVEKEI